MKLNITVQKCKAYTNPVNCGIAKGLKKKGILANVGSEYWNGVFLGFIPVWGTIPCNANDIAHKSCEEGFVPTKTKIGLFE